MADTAEGLEQLRWTNPSVRAIAGDADPLQVVTERARALMFAALDAGLSGPPFDPFALAGLLGIGIHARADVADARIRRSDAGERTPTGVPLASFVPSQAPLTIEYNPSRPRGRLRYSVAHEIAHALFPDVGDAVRHRTATGAIPGQGAEDDSWQLELLCNVAGSEFLMPVEAVAGILDIDPDIDFLMATRTKLDVSTEALLRRVAHETNRPLAIVASSRVADSLGSNLRCEYVVHSRTWRPAAVRGLQIDGAGPFGEPTAVGQTVRGKQLLAGEPLLVQAVGIAPYPGRVFPRVLGLVEPAGAPRSTPIGIDYVLGDVSRPHGEGPLLVAHVVSSAARSWSRRGVGKSLTAAFPDAATAYHQWSVASPENLRLGNVHLVRAATSTEIYVASMVAQQGFGPASRLSYQALRDALRSLAHHASRLGASLHMPRIGAGEAGGRWDLIEQEIEQSLLGVGLTVKIYTPSRTIR